MRAVILCLLLLGAGLLAACGDDTRTLKDDSMEPVIHTEAVTYSAGGVAMNGYLAYDEKDQRRRPGVLVVHEWWGHNEYARRRARMLAALGYTALAVDMYGDGKTAAHPDSAAAFMQAVAGNMDAGQQRFEAAMQVLKNHPTVDPEKIAAIGYCFGGGVVLEMARRGLDLDGVVSFHGGLNTEAPAQPGAVTARVLVLHGTADAFIPQEAVDAFKQEMDSAGVDYRFVAYEGVQHSFTNSDIDSVAAQFGLPAAYDAEADAQSWAEMQAFFKTIF